MRYFALAHSSAPPKNRLAVELTRRELCSGQRRRTRHWPRVDSQPVVHTLAVEARGGHQPPESHGEVLSAQRDETGGWQIDPAELHRVFPPLPAPATSSPASAQRDAMVDALVAELRAVIADLRQDRDRWREAFQEAQRRLPPPAPPRATEPPPPRNRLIRAWRWMRATG